MHIKESGGMMNKRQEQHLHRNFTCNQHSGKARAIRIIFKLATLGYSNE